MNACKPVYALLSTNSVLQALVGTNVYAKLAKQGTQAPYLIYEQVDAVLEPIIDATQPRLWRARVQLMAVADDYATVKSVLEAAVRACNYQRGSIAGVQVALIIHDSAGADDFDVGTQQFYQSSDLTVLYLDDGS